MLYVSWQKPQNVVKYCSKCPFYFVILNTDFDLPLFQCCLLLCQSGSTPHRWAGTWREEDIWCVESQAQHSGRPGSSHTISHTSNIVPCLIFRFNRTFFKNPQDLTCRKQCPSVVFLTQQLYFYFWTFSQHRFMLTWSRHCINCSCFSSLSAQLSASWTITPMWPDAKMASKPWSSSSNNLRNFRERERQRDTD